MPARTQPIADLVAEIRDPLVSAGRLAELAGHSSKTVRGEVADNPAIDDATLLRLSADSDELVRLTAAGLAAGRPDVEPALAASPDKWVRAILAHTYAVAPGDLTRETQRLLAADTFFSCRARIAETTTYRNIFDTLLIDEHPDVRASCAANIRALRSDVDELLSDRSWRTRAGAVGVGERYPDAGQLLLAASDRSAAVRRAALYRAGAPREVADRLKDDPDEDIRAAARASLRKNALWSARVEREELERRAALPKLAFEA